MKYVLPLLAMFSLCFTAAFAEELPEDLQDMQNKYKNRMKVWALNDDDVEENDLDYFEITFQTRQDRRDEGELKYQLRIAVQLTDKKTKEVVYSRTTTAPKDLPEQESGDGSYGGYTEWAFRIPFGQLKKPKLTACAIEFGFTEGSTFVPVATLYDDVDSIDEILKGGGTKVRMRCTQNEHFIVRGADRGGRR